MTQAESINPNVSLTPETSGETVQAAPGAVLSFDDVEAAIVAAPKQETGKGSGNGEVRKTGKQADQKADEKEITSKADGEKEETGKESKKDSKPAPDKIEKKIDDAIRKLAAKRGEETYEIPEDAEIEFKADGKIVKMTMAQVRDKAAGNLHLERRDKELKDEKSAFDRQVQFVNKNVDEIMGMAKNNPMGAFYRLCKLAGKNPDEVAESYRTMVAQAARMSEMSEEALSAALAREEVAEMRNARAAEEAARRAAEEQQAEEQARLRIVEAYQIPEQDYAAISQYALQVHQKAATPEQVAYLFKVKQTEEILHDIDPELLSDEIHQGFAWQAFQNPDLSAQDLRRIAEESFVSESARRLGKKMASQPASKPQATQSARNDSPLSFDDIA